MRLLVCGGREFNSADDRAWVYRVLDCARERVQIKRGGMMIIQGACKTGTDRFARDWCKSRMVGYRNYPPDWSKHALAAGPLRNQEMIDKGKPDMFLPFPGGRGTADMTRRADRARIPRWRSCEVEQIERAAIEFLETVWTVPQPGRHADVIKRVCATWPSVETVGGVQGFWTSDFRFVKREEARVLAELADQIIAREIGPDGVPFKREHKELFSEDVW